jgi:cytochrome P450
MHSSIERPEDYKVPDDIARTVISPASYTDDNVIHPALKWLRANRPIGYAEVEGYDPMWILSRHADIMEMERNQNQFHSADYNPVLNTRVADAFSRKMNNGSPIVVAALTHKDPPDHGIYRQIAAGWFGVGNIRRLEDMVRPIARAAVTRLMDMDRECDFVRDFALLYPLHVIMSLFGVPPEDEPKMLKLTQEFFGAHDPEERREDVPPDEEAAARQFYAALQDFYAYFSALTADRRANPRDDLLSIVANARVNGALISDWEANGYYVTIATAGHDTTSSSVAGGLLGLIQRPTEFAKVKADPSLTAGLVDEAVRFTSPVKHFMRSSASDTVFQGVPIKAGERFMLSYPSANRDESVFDAPDEFRIDRRPNRHIGFGFGPHMCLGMHLAKLEMRILYEELLPKLSAIELAGAPRYVETNFVGGLKSLPIRFTKV